MAAVESSDSRELFMSDLKAPAPQTRKLSTTQIVLIGLAVLLVAFLIIGSLIRPDTSNQLMFGVQQQPFATLAVLSFLGGLLSFASPCTCLLYTSPSPRDRTRSRMPSSA